MKLTTILGLFVDPIFFLWTKKKKSALTADTPIEVPTNDASNIPVLFGTRQILSPKIAWYGDLKILKQSADTQRKKG